MLRFREDCWRIVSEGESRSRIYRPRKFSGSKAYKADGLSYVLTIYLLLQNDLCANEINHLMRSTVFSKVLDSSQWDKINDTVMNTECEDCPSSLRIGDVNTYYSWSAVAVEVKDSPSTFDDIIDNPIVSTLLRAELYIQSRWFVADNSMDNANRDSHCNMESLQRIASFIEFSQAELESDISANMNTLYKRILEHVATTSEVKQLYKSVASQIRTQKKDKRGSVSRYKKKEQTHC